MVSKSIVEELTRAHTKLNTQHVPVSHVHTRLAAAEAITHLSPGPWEGVFPLCSFQQAAVDESRRCLQCRDLQRTTRLIVLGMK